MEMSAIGYQEKHIKIGIEIGDRAEERGAFGNLGIVYHWLDHACKIIVVLQNLPDRSSMVESKLTDWLAPTHFNLTKSGPLCKKLGHRCLKICLRSTAGFKINFRELYQEMYIASWRLSLRIKKSMTDFWWAKQGRAQTLPDNFFESINFLRPYKQPQLTPKRR